MGGTVVHHDHTLRGFTHEFQCETCGTDANAQESAATEPMDKIELEVQFNANFPPMLPGARIPLEKANHPSVHAPLQYDAWCAWFEEGVQHSSSDLRILCSPYHTAHDLRPYHAAHSM